MPGLKSVCEWSDNQISSRIADREVAPILLKRIIHSKMYRFWPLILRDLQDTKAPNLHLITGTTQPDCEQGDDQMSPKIAVD